jgi:uncharacterized protein YkwD
MRRTAGSGAPGAWMNMQRMPLNAPPPSEDSPSIRSRIRVHRRVRFWNRRRSARPMSIPRRLVRLHIAAAAACGLAALALFSGCTAESQAELKTYTGINAIRAEHGLPPLTPDPSLLEVARFRSRDMASVSYFSHDPPDGCNYACLLDQHGIDYAWAGENIAWNTWDWSKTADVAVQMWRNSPPHLANITNCHFERFAAGVAKAGDGKVYYTMIFEGSRAC